MKKVISKIIVAIFIIVFLVSCSSPIDSIDFVKQTEFSGKLTVSVVGLTDSISYLADEFIKLHPDVEIEIEPVYADLTGYDTDFLEQTLSFATKVMSGEAGDLVDVSNIDRFKYSKSGLFYDFYEIMESDTNFVKEDYYSNIFKALEYKKGLYFLPVSIQIPAYRINKVVAEKINIDYENIDTINAIEMIDIYDKALKSGFVDKNFKLLDSPYNGATFDSVEANRFIDYENETATYDTKEYIDHLKTMTKTEPSPEYLFQYINEWEVNPENVIDKCMFTTSDIDALTRMDTTLHEYEYFSKSILFTDSLGRRPFYATNMYALTKSSKNPKLAWEFLKFMLEEKDYSKMDIYEQYYNSNTIPINIANSKGMGSDEINDWLYNTMTSLDFCSNENVELLRITDSLATDFFQGSITAEEFAKEYQTKVETYLKE